MGLNGAIGDDEFSGAVKGVHVNVILDPAHAQRLSLMPRLSTFWERKLVT